MALFIMNKWVQFTHKIFTRLNYKRYFLHIDNYTYFCRSFINENNLIKLLFNIIFRSYQLDTILIILWSRQTKRARHDEAILLKYSNYMRWKCWWLNVWPLFLLNHNFSGWWGRSPCCQAIFIIWYYVAVFQCFWNVRSIESYLLKFLLCSFSFFVVIKLGFWDVKGFFMRCNLINHFLCLLHVFILKIL